MASIAQNAQIFRFISPAFTTVAAMMNMKIVPELAKSASKAVALKDELFEFLVEEQ
jgi:hypothetical protein